METLMTGFVASRPVCCFICLDIIVTHVAFHIVKYMHMQIFMWCSHFDSFLNPFKLNGISHCYQLDQSISVLRVVGWYI